MGAAILAIRFFLELCLLAALAVGGWTLAGGGIDGGLLAVFALVVVATVWGVWIAPRSKRRLTDPLRFTLEVVLFLLGAMALWTAWTPVVGIVFAVASIVIAVLTRVVGEPTPEPRRADS